MTDPRGTTVPAVWGLASATVLLHLAVNAFDSYGIFRDEFYYLACARHLAWGYVDHPPLSIALLALQTAIAGDSLFSLRLLPSLLSGAIVVLAAGCARELGGGRFAQITASLVALLVPCFRGFGGFYSMNVIDLAIWATVTWLLARLANGADRRLWLVVGLALGLGLNNKLSVLYLGAGLALGMIVSPLRRSIATPWPWLAALLSLALLLPHGLWQAANGWPTREFIANAAQYKNVHHTPFSFLAGVVMEGNPAFLPVWLVGLGYLLLAAGRHRWAGGLAGGVLVLLIATGTAKPYYADTALFVLVVGFAVALERWLRPTWARAVALTYLVVTGLLALPFALPVLPVETFIAYQSALGLTPPAAERHQLTDLPQFYADRFGWRELAEAVETAYGALTPDERARAYVFAQNYGQAAALEYHARSYDLPPVLSGHNSYWLWGDGEATWDVLLVVDDQRARLEELFASVERATVKRCEHCMPHEDDLPVWICRGLKMRPAELWSEVRSFI